MHAKSLIKSLLLCAIMSPMHTTFNSWSVLIIVCVRWQHSPLFHLHVPVTECMHKNVSVCIVVEPFMQLVYCQFRSGHCVIMSSGDWSHPHALYLIIQYTIFLATFYVNLLLKFYFSEAIHIKKISRCAFVSLIGNECLERHGECTCLCVPGKT